MIAVCRTRPVLSLVVHSAKVPERRDHVRRAELVRRVRAEYEEMPCLRLTAAQAQRLFDLRPDVCNRVLTGLTVEKVLWLGSDGRYSVRGNQA
jgi:hypothetical protein